ncbi:MAG: Fe(3+) ABC transporter substrate-binding protein [Flavobacteriales bacterium]
MQRALYLFPLLAAACGSPAPEPTPVAPPEQKVVNVYSHRHYDTDKQLFDAFTKKTGITVNLVLADDDEVLARLQAEGDKSPCDLLITSDGGRLGLAKSMGLLQPSKSDVLNANVPAHLRDPEGYWYGLTTRARVVAYNKTKVKPGSIVTYDDLTAAKWKGKVLVRSSENVYNQSLLAAMIAHNGPEAASTWAKGIVKNMARQPEGSDTDQMLALAEGIGDVAIVNSYYAGKLLASTEPEKQKARDVIALMFPSIGTFGTHVNVSGGGVAKNAPHPDEAIALLEFLSGDEAQALFGATNKEYPVKAGVAAPAELVAFGAFKADTLALEALGRLNADAVKILDEAGWR